MSVTPPVVLPSVEELLRQDLPEKLKPFAGELAAFLRALPRLLAEEEAGRYVVVSGGELLGVWDTHRDAMQYGTERCGEGRFLVQSISPIERDRWDQYLSQLRQKQGAEACPS